MNAPATGGIRTRPGRHVRRAAISACRPTQIGRRTARRRRQLVQLDAPCHGPPQDHRGVSGTPAFAGRREGELFPVNYLKLTFKRPLPPREDTPRGWAAALPPAFVDGRPNVRLVHMELIFYGEGCGGHWHVDPTAEGDEIVIATLQGCAWFELREGKTLIDAPRTRPGTRTGRALRRAALESRFSSGSPVSCCATSVSSSASLVTRRSREFCMRAGAGACEL